MGIMLLLDAPLKMFWPHLPPTGLDHMMTVTNTATSVSDMVSIERQSS